MTLINGIEIDNVRYTENDIKKAILNNSPIEDKLHVIIVISNPCNYAIRYILAKEFIRRMKDESNVILYVVELAYSNQDFHITDSKNPRHLQLRTNTIPLWHKENMINLGVKNLLPHDYKAFAWIDADLEFDNPHWALDTLKILNGSRDIVQLYSNVLFMDEHGDTEIIFTSLGFQWLKKTKRADKSLELSYWHPGFAWACTRTLYEKMGGLFEYAITGNGDTKMASCFLSEYKSTLTGEESNDYKKSLELFEQKVVGCRVGYVPGILHHHYHGSLQNRQYQVRAPILNMYNFSPSIHLTHDSNGLLIPTKEFPEELEKAILTHFQAKNEDNLVTKLNIKNILEFKFKKMLNTNCILINLKKDTHRLASSIEELDKLSVKQNEITFIKSVYWKDPDFENEVNSIFTFLRQFNPSIPEQIKINEFSEISDPNIKIQNGPLACYCSHIKSMIHGYLNFKDYTIICEDDLMICEDDISNIEKYIYLIPDDWDIICCNAEPKERKNKNPYYKLTDIFYHLHFYIIKNKRLKTIFQNIYPVTDQIDILIGRMHDKLNIYNIIGTIKQKNFITNIQNNLHVIYNTPVYAKLVKELNLLNKICNDYVNEKLPDNNENINKNITNKIIEDVIYVNIFNNLNNTNISNTYNVNNNKLYRQIQKILLYYIKDEKYVNLDTNRYNKNSNVDEPINEIEDALTCNYASFLLNDIDYILNSFNLHNKDANILVNDYIINEKLKAYGFGSTSSIYLLEGEKYIIKEYNNKLRWSCKNHDNLKEIYNTEISIMKRIPDISGLITYDDDKLSIRMEYLGESLYNNFTLPDDWQTQLIDTFHKLTCNNIYYPEFNLNNIVVLNNKINFIDYGLAQIVNKPDNTNNCAIFIELLDLLDERYKSEKDLNKRHILYNTFMNNLRIKKTYPLNVF